MNPRTVATKLLQPEKDVHTDKVELFALDRALSLQPAAVARYRPIMPAYQR